MKKVAFIGMGNMAQAMLKGIETVFGKEQIIFSRKNKEEGKKFSIQNEIEMAKDNVSCAEAAKYIILAVKPQFFPEVLEEIRPVLKKEQIVISIAAGIERNVIGNALGEEVKIVRAMPNMPAIVGEGMTGITYDAEKFSVTEIEEITAIFHSFGQVQYVEEHQMNVVTCISGSSPAYMYLFLEALADSGVKYGLSRESCYKMAAQTMLGAAKMVLETKEHPAVLKDKICSPGGTTIAGVTALEEFGFRNAVLKATDACFKKSMDISK